MAPSLDGLKERVSRLEDIVAVHEAVAGYGLTVDGGVRDLGRILWTEDDGDGPDVAGGYGTTAGAETGRNAGIGCAHLTHLPVVVVDGDRAAAYAAAHVAAAQEGDTFAVGRVSADKWDLERVDGRWRIRRRTSRALDGSPEAKSIFAEGARRAVAERPTTRAGGTEPNGGGDDMTSQETNDFERRIGELEDKLAILQVVAGYGPSVDGGAVREAGSLWTEDSWYDTDSSPAAAKPHGRAGIEGAAQRFLDDPVGLAHISHLPLIRVDGDRAIAVNHSNTFHQEGEQFRLGRVSANRWDLVRVDGRWQIKRRVNRLLNGSAESKSVLATGTRQILAP